MTNKTKEAWEKFETLCLAFMERASSIYLSKERIECDGPLLEAMKQEILEILIARSRLYDAIEDEAREKSSKSRIILNWYYDVCTPIDFTVMEIHKAVEVKDYDSATDARRWIGRIGHAKDSAKHIIDSL